MLKNKFYRKTLVFTLMLLISLSSFAGNIELRSPDNRVGVNLLSEELEEGLRWYLQLDYMSADQKKILMPKISIGLVRSDQDFSKGLKLLKAGKSKLINEQYIAIHGKRSQRQNSGREQIFFFENQNKLKMNVVVRAYNDGLVFRYEFPGKGEVYVVEDEFTAYEIPGNSLRWLQKFDLSNESVYDKMQDGSKQGDWCYPALFKSTEEELWYLIHEADVDRGYAATKLSNSIKESAYKVELPLPHEGEGEAKPSITLPWQSPWRVVIMGDLAKIVESTLVEDVSKPSVINNTDWIKPGKVSWNYWSNNHGTRDYQIVKEFTDLALAMQWPYTLFDWEWDAMSNGGNVEDAAKYALSKGVKPFIWYNSGMFKWITATPVDRMKTHENRMKEFAWLKSLGFVGVKVDFFLSEKQYMINYYLDILEDAAKFEMMVNFHGSLVPRGWARTYPNLMTMEAVRGAEWYNNGPEFAYSAPKHNTVMVFTRNVIGSMDYTPTTFTNSQYPHITSYGHELALSVVFESALQHMADRPEGYYNLPGAVRSFLKNVPVVWDDTKLLDGYPERNVLIARRKGGLWYLGGLNSEQVEKTQNINFDFLQENQKYKLTLISDGKHDKEFTVLYKVIDSKSEVDVKILRRGGFAACIEPFIE